MNAVIIKGYATESAAQKFVAKYFANRNDITIEFAGGVWLVVGA